MKLLPHLVHQTTLPGTTTWSRWLCIRWLVLAALTAASASAVAAVSDATVQRLVEQVAALTARVQQLEDADRALREENEALKKQSATVPTKPANSALAWAENTQLSGDIRYRYENIDDAAKTNHRNRSRVRARIEAQAQVNDDWRVGFGLASGSADPVSSNQTLGDGGSSKGVNIDLAYFDWTGIDDVHVLGGKFKNPFYKPAKHSLVWDGDYRPEGLALKYDNGAVFANAAFLYLESDDKAGSQDAESYWGSQLGWRTAIDESTQLLLGISYYDIGVAGSKPFFTNDDFGNTLAGGVYAHDYRELEVFAELAFSLFELPANVFADWVENQDADNNEHGWASGLKIGKAKNPGTAEFAYIYQDLEADAVFGLTTDSDFGGGGTNVKGHLIKAAYALDKNVSLKLSYFMNEKGDAETDYDRLQMDLILKY